MLQYMKEAEALLLYPISMTMMDNLRFFSSTSGKLSLSRLDHVTIDFR